MSATVKRRAAVPAKSIFRAVLPTAALVGGLGLCEAVYLWLSSHVSVGLLAEWMKVLVDRFLG